REQSRSFTGFRRCSRFLGDSRVAECISTAKGCAARLPGIDLGAWGFPLFNTTTTMRLTIVFLIFWAATAAPAQTPITSPNQPATPAVASPQLDAIVQDPKLWEATGAQIVERNRELWFRWLSNTRDAAQSTRPGLTLF